MRAGRLFALSVALVAMACAPALAQAACNVSGVDIGFGGYDPLSAAPATSVGSITVTCDQSPPPIVTLQLGPSATNGSFAPRELRLGGGSDLLSYNLYTDPGGLQVWGDGTAGTTVLTQRVQKNKPWTATVYARMPAGQDVTVGSYVDALSITIQF